MSMTKGTPASSQIINLERMVEERDAEIDQLRKQRDEYKAESDNLQARYTELLNIYVDQKIMTHITIQQRNDLQASYDKLRALLKVAICPCCDGSGAIQTAPDEVEQCWWCDERQTALARAGGV